MKDFLGSLKTARSWIIRTWILYMGEDEEMKKSTFFTIIYVGLIVGVIAFLIFMIFWLQGESAVCMKDPITYYANKTAQMCYCNDGLGWARG